MTIHLGYVPASSVLYIPFHTFNAAGASVTITGLAVTDIEIYKNGSVTQRASDAGYTLLDTDGIDFDGLTGIHGFSIDLADNTDSGFYAAGSTYWVVVSAVTVDSQTVSFVAATFFIGPVAANVTQWLSTAAATPTVAGVPEVDVTHWIGTAAATPTTAGVPEVDITFISGSAVSTTTAQLGVNVVQVSGDGTAADNIETAYDDTAGAVPWTGIVDQGTMQAGSTGTTAVLRAAASFADDVLIGATIHITAGTGIGQRRLVTDWVSATDTATVDTWVTTPDNTSVYKVYATAPSSGGSGLDAAGVRAAVGLASANLDTQLSTIDTVVDAILVDTGTTLDARIPAALVSGRMDASVGAMAANVITAAATAADFTTEVTSGLATAAALDTVDNFLDTEIAALTTAVADLPTNAELATALGTADDAVLAAVATVDTVVDAIKVQTDKFANLPVLTAGGTGGQGYGAP